MPQKRATRVAAATIGLDPPCCLRCSKAQHTEDFEPCVKLNNRKVCERCKKKNNVCDEVPPSAVVRCNRVSAMSAAYRRLRRNDPNRDEALAELTRASKVFTSFVAAEVRAAAIPLDPGKQGALAIGELRQINTHLASIVEIGRNLAGMAPLSKTNVDPDDDDDDDDDVLDATHIETFF